MIETPHAPAPIGPYAQARIHQGLLYCSGQIGITPNTAELVTEHFVAQATQMFHNLTAVATAAGTSLEHTIRVNVYLTDFNHFAALNELMTHFFQSPYPARSTIQVAGLPKNAWVEVDAIIAIPDAGDHDR